MTIRKHEDALMYWLIMLSGVTILPYFVEPWLDVIGATTYMTNTLPYVTIADRPLPIFVPLVWVGTAPTALVVYEMIKKVGPLGRSSCSRWCLESPSVSGKWSTATSD